MIPPARTATLITVLLGLALAGCVAQHRASPAAWFADRGAVLPRGDAISVCHAFGCHLKTAVSFTPADLRRMRRMLKGARSPAAERARIARFVAWAETRVAPAVGSADDVGGLDLGNAGEAGQMDCIDEAANTTSYLLVAQRHGLLAHHSVASPVARGFFLDGRYPHATAVVVDPSGTPWAVDSWPHRNGAKPDVLPLETWFERSPAR